MQYSSADENSASDSLPTRRDAIKVLSAVAASALTGGGLADGARSDGIPADATLFFTPEEVRLVEAVSEQIIGSSGSRMRGGLKKADMLILIGVTSNHLQERDQHLHELTLPCLWGSRLQACENGICRR
jgi:hypothetical protein